MRKLGLIILTLFVALPIALCAIAAQAAPIDSTASGVYIAPDRVCRVVLSRYQTLWVQADIRCLNFSGISTASLTTVYAPGSCPQGGAYWLNPWPPGQPPEYLSLRSYDPAGTLAVLLGNDPTNVYNGIGSAQTWYRVGAVPSPSPYSCGGSASDRKGG